MVSLWIEYTKAIQFTEKCIILRERSQQGIPAAPETNTYCENSSLLVAAQSDFHERKLSDFDLSIPLD